MWVLLPRAALRLPWAVFFRAFSPTRPFNPTHNLPMDTSMYVMKLNEHISGSKCGKEVSSEDFTKSFTR